MGGIVNHLFKFVFLSSILGYVVERCFLVLIKTKFWLRLRKSLKAGCISFILYAPFIPHISVAESSDREDESTDEESDGQSVKWLHPYLAKPYVLDGGRSKNNNYSKNCSIESLNNPLTVCMLVFLTVRLIGETVLQIVIGILFSGGISLCNRLTQRLVSPLVL